MKKAKLLTVRIDDDLHGLLKTTTAADRTTMSAYLTGLMVKDLRKRGVLKARKRAK